MALIAFDGFDNYSTSNATDLLNRRGGGFQWNYIGFASPGNIVTPGRGGFGSMLQLFTNALIGTLTTALSIGFFGVAAKINGLSTTVYAQYPSFAFGDSIGGLVEQVTIVMNLVSGGFDIWRGPGGGSGAVLIGTSQNNAFTTGVWNYIEILAGIDASAGAITINCNGQNVCTLSGLNTQVTSRANFDTITISAGTLTFDIDDFYVADTTTGPGLITFASFAGDVRVATQQPISNGASTQWTPLTGTNWGEVSEVHNDGDTSYNSTTTINNKDLFHFAALAATITSVLAVQIVGSYRKDDAGVHTMEQHLVSSSTEVAGVTQFVPLGYVYFDDLWTVDPNTAAAWTITAVNALQAGYKLLS